METTSPSGTFLGPTQLFDRAWMIFEKKWKTMLVVGLPLVGLIVMWVVFIALLIGGVGAGMMVSKGNGASLAGLGIAGAVVGVIAYIVFILGCIWVQLAELYVIVNHEREVSFSEAYGSSRKYILSMIWVGILTAAITGMGFMALIVPGIIIAVWFMFGQFVLVDQKVRGLNALLTSREYVRGRWSAVFGRMALFSIVYFVLIMLLSAVQGVVKDSSISGLVSLLSLVVQMVLGLLATLYSYSIYENLKALKGTNIPIASSTRTKFSIIGWLGAVLLILAILLPIALLALNPAGALKGIHNATRLADLATTQKAVETYYVSNNRYPASLDVLVQGGMLPKVPVDPKTQSPLSYQVNSDGSDFKLCTHLDPVDNTSSMKIPTDANGDYCVTAHSSTGIPNTMQYPNNAGGTMLEGSPESSGAGMMDTEDGQRMMRPQDYQEDQNSGDTTAPNRY